MSGSWIRPAFLAALVAFATGVGELRADEIVETDVVAANSADEWSVRVCPGAAVRVIVSGNGHTDLDLFIYDEEGNLVACDTDSTDYCVVRWTACSCGGQFRIRIENLGCCCNAYVLSIRR